MKIFSRIFDTFMARRMLLGLLCILIYVSCAPENKPSSENTIKIGTYNLWCSDSRLKYINNDSGIDRQRFWNTSAEAVAEIVSDMDCDVYAFQEICDSIYGKKGQATSLKNLMGDDFEWKIWSNVDGSPVSLSSGKLSYSPGICYRKGVVAFLDGGVFWLGGNPAKPEFVRSDSFDPQYGDSKRACQWARMRHKASGKVFYFLSAHLDTRSFSGVSYPMVNEENCRNLMAHADRYIVPEGVPSIIAGDMNTGIELSSGKVHKGYSILTDNQGGRHEWKDAYVLAGQAGVLGQTAALSPVTTNSSKGDRMGNARIDHVFVEGLQVTGYEICQKKYKTENGSEHYPSDHFPVIVTLKF